MLCFPCGSRATARRLAEGWSQAMKHESEKPAAGRGATMPESAGEQERTFQPRSVLKDHGLRYSRPRELILGYLLEGKKHVSAESLYLALKQRGENLSLSTVYLNLGVLSHAGLIREFKGSSGQSFYDSNVTPHYHVVCRETGEILDIPAPMVDGKPLGRFLKETIEAATGWKVDEPRLSLSGLSPRAQERRED